MVAYSLDLRERIIKCWQQGQQKSAIGRVFMVGLSTVKRYIKQFQSKGHVRPVVQGHMLGKLNSKLRKRVARQVEAHPDFTLAQHVAWWNQRMSVQVSESILSRAVQRLGLTRKKKTIGAVERDEAERLIFQAVIKTLKVEEVVVLDEFGSHIGMIPLYARAPRGCRAYDRALRNHGHNLTLLAALNLDGIQAAMTLEGAVDEATFEVFIRDVLLPTLHPGQIIILDNLSSHKTDSVLDLLRCAGCQVLFLPPYSPDYSPIEEAYSKLKAFVRRCRCQTLPELLRAIEEGLSKWTVTDIRGWFAHAGFSISAHCA